MKPYLLQLKSQFLMYDVRNILRLPSVHSIRIYELLKQYERIGKRVFELEELKEILGLKDKYRLYGHFKKRILLKAQEDLIDQCDIAFRFEEVKKGRAVHKIKFIIRKNIPGSQAQQQLQLELPVSEEEQVLEIEKSAVFDKLYDDVRHWGITKRTLQKYIDKYKISYIQQRIVYVKQQISVKEKSGESINNLGGYFHTLMEEPDLFDHQEAKKEKRRYQRKQRVAASKNREQIEQQLKNLKKELFEKKVQLVEQILQKYPEIQKEIFQRVRLRYNDVYDDAHSELENYRQHLGIKIQVNLLVFNAYPEKFVALDEKYEKKIQALQTKR